MKEPVFEDVDNPGKWHGYWHKMNVANTDHTAKVARHFHPITAVKTSVGKDDDGTKERAYTHKNACLVSINRSNKHNVC